MGKRSKGKQKDDDDVKVTSKKKRSDNFSLSGKIVTLNDDVKVKVSIDKKITGNGKNKKIVFDTEDYQKMPTEVTTIENSVSSKKNLKKTLKNKSQVGKKKEDKRNKNDIFPDDTDGPSNVKYKNESKKTKSNYEEEPKDEEIDEFCNEVEEEDNVQYENWVKLVEEKLNSSKKK